ncbi:MAG: DNA polymerase III subunit delta [Bacteroidia bacterium]|nr:DNA polymerase III subunit delta [Bacteroidia bacterium]MDW8417204.1 DNA polymerase III subunit delta [Bacteroidia bacterium]
MIWILYGEDEFRRSERRKALIQEQLGEASPEFALTVWRGKGLNESILPQLYELPFLLSHKVVALIFESENLTKSDIKILTHYFQKPAPHTRLIIEVASSTKPDLPTGEGVYYELFKPLRSKEVTDWVLLQAREKGLNLPSESAALLVDLLGTDLRLLSQMVHTFEIFLANHREKSLTPEVISESLGLNPLFTPYKLTDALAANDTKTALRIGGVFAEEIREYPLSQIIWHLRTFYQNLAHLHLTKTPPNAKSIQERLGLRFAFQAKVYELALPRISLQACEYALRVLRETDARQKGVIPNRHSDKQLMLGMIMDIILPKKQTL